MKDRQLNAGTLFVVATPIGNLNDMSARAIEVLRSVDLIAAEDTRVTGRLLSNFGVKSRQIALHDHNEERQADRLIAEIQRGQTIALVSDAGTPSISDPGYRLLRAAHLAGIRVSPIPGASALVASLSASGLPTDRFVFEGFLPAKKAARQKKLQSLAAETRTMIFFESVHRIAASVVDMIDVFGEGRAAFLARELTKLHEQTVFADLRSLAAMLDDNRITSKGEFALVVSGASNTAAQSDAIDIDTCLTVLASEMPGKQAAALTARITGKSRNDLYRRLLVLKNQLGSESDADPNPPAR